MEKTIHTQYSKIIIFVCGAADKKIDYVQYIKDAYEKAIKNAPIRKADIKR